MPEKAVYAWKWDSDAESRKRKPISGEGLTKNMKKLSNQYFELNESYKKLEKENSSLHEKNTSFRKEKLISTQ